MDDHTHDTLISELTQASDIDAVLLVDMKMDVASKQR